MMNNKKTNKENYIACLLGGAIGDALGAPIEFMSIDEINQTYGQSGVKGYVEFENSEGEFTDDTQMTLFTAEGLLRARYRYYDNGLSGGIYQISYESLQRWYYTQNHEMFEEPERKNRVLSNWLIKQKELYKRRAPGNTCLSALKSRIKGTIVKPVNNSKGCGTVMRMAPVGLYVSSNASKAFELGCSLSAFTHGHPSGYLSGGFLAAVITLLVSGVSLKDAIDKTIQILKEYRGFEETLNAVEKALELYQELTESCIEATPRHIEQIGQGWVAEEALAMSLFASLLFEQDFEKGVLYSVNHSGDSDSTGAITGNVLGLINGISSIPVQWIENLKYASLVREIADDLYDGYRTDDFWAEKYKE